MSTLGPHHRPSNTDNSSKTLWQDLVVAVLLIGGATFLFGLFLLPLAVSIKWLGTPWSFGVIAIYAFTFCYTAYRAALERTRLDDKEVTLEMKIRG